MSRHYQITSRPFLQKIKSFRLKDQDILKFSLDLFRFCPDFFKKDKDLDRKRSVCDWKKIGTFLKEDTDLVAKRSGLTWKEVMT